MVGMGLGTGLEVKKIWQRGASRAANLRNRGMAAEPCFLNAPNQLYVHSKDVHEVRVLNIHTIE